MQKKLYRNGLTADPQKTTVSNNVVWVHFYEPHDGQEDYFFGSILAIFAKFNPAEINAAPRHLYAAIDAGVDTGKCLIKRAPVVRCKMR